ncbi:NAD(P)H-binding protein [Microlunatus speluncae]|uniref:NAD(P)H-binding protein n=1 Tax=Microlunatus speluncae TaxID=2594267 RepID=UPI0012666C86|nr:NAD(P)H-binding protein [Microlunatus speluncae]
MTILVTGATGNVGRLVVDELIDRNAPAIRALTVDPDRAKLPAGVEVAVGSIHKPATVPAALAGVTTLYLAPHPPTAQAIVDHAVAAGVQRIVDLTGPAGSWWDEIEPIVEASGLAWTHLKPGEFMPNATVWADRIKTRREVRDAYPQAANAMIDLGDIAAAAAVAVLDESHSGQAYPLTGPESLTKVEKITIMGRAIGADVPFVEISRDEAIAQLAPTMGDYAEWYVDGAKDLVDHPQQVDPALPKLLGRPAVTFTQWAEANAHQWR